MGTPASHINNWSSWAPGLANDFSHDLAPEISAINKSFMDQTTSQVFYSNDPIPPIADIPSDNARPSNLSRPRSETSPVSHNSSDTRSNPDDLDTSTSLNRRSSKSPNDYLSPASSEHKSNSKVKKCTLNTLAARRYRQKRVDQMQGLESALKDTETERDELKLQVARLEAEVNILRGLLGSGSSKSS